jgi:formylglycine-generating enzyme required for sulfatase activity
MAETRTLGDYHLIKQVGQGSLGTVYLAEHRYMKKQYILKVFPEELASDRSFIQRFEEEVGILSALEHPHIVKIHTVSFSQGQYFLVTDCIVDEFGETTNLAQYMLARGMRFDEETLYRLMRQIAEALDYAHGKIAGGKEIFHRSLKLNNILISKGRGGIDLTLSDFGLSKIVGTGAVLSRTYKCVAETLNIASSLYSQMPGQERYPNPPIEQQKLQPLHASFLQNFAFLAPEQSRLDPSFAVSAKVDAYAFGTLVYYLLMGEFPMGIFDMPSTHLSNLNWNWDLLVSSCLQFNPHQRPENLVEMIEAIRTPVRAVALAFEAASSTALQQSDLQPPLSSLSHAPEPSFETIEKISVDQPIIKQHEQPISERHAPDLQSQQHSDALKPVLKTTQLERPVHDLDPGAVFHIDTTVKQYIPERKEVRNIQPLLTEMVVIPSGTFYRGSTDGNRDELPKHRVTLTSFAIDIHPVTNEQFVRFLEVMGGEKDGNHQDIIRLRDSRVKRIGGKLSIESGYAKHPVVGVTWYGAIAYAKWIGKRLPTEAEWEIAARGGLENVLYPPGDDIEKTQANFFSSDTTAVMSYAPNGYGLYDIVGNVYEWCYDWYGYNYYEISVQEPENPQGPLQGVYRVLRGGCWKSLKEDLRCSRRHRNNPGAVNGTYGFRCAADAQ